MTAVDANADDTAAQQPPAPPVVGPMAGDPAMLGLGSFIVGSVALGLALVGVVPVGVLGAPLAIILAATARGLLMPLSGPPPSARARWLPSSASSGPSG